MKERSLYITLLLFAQLILSIAVAILPGEVYRRAAMLLVMLLPLLLFRTPPEGTKRLRILPEAGTLPLLLLLPAFILAICLTSLGWGALADLLGITLRGAEPIRPLALAILLDAAVPAIGEECFARGAILSVLRPHGRRTAVIGSAIVFALMHASLAQIPYAFLAGLLLGMLYELSGGLLLPILFHFGSNLFSLLLLFGAPPLPFLIGLGAAALLGILLLLRLRPRPIPEAPATEVGGIRALLLSPLLLWIGAIIFIMLL